MDKTSFANGITAEDLRDFLRFWPLFSAEVDEVTQMLVEEEDRLFAEDSKPCSWCHLYELPIEGHIALLFLELSDHEQVANWHRQIIETPGQIGALPGVVNQVHKHFNAMEAPNKEDTEKMRPILAAFIGTMLSVSHSLYCVLYHGCFLNELIVRVRAGDDKALFDAVRIDPTVVGCKSIIERISKAALLRDHSFFAKLKAAMNRKMAKREQANFQKMRLVLEILHEKGATRLNDKQLRQLFVEELQLYSGDNDKALRKFADTYMKKSTAT